MILLKAILKYLYNNLQGWSLYFIINLYLSSWSFCKKWQYTGFACLAKRGLFSKEPLPRFVPKRLWSWGQRINLNLLQNLWTYWVHSSADSFVHFLVGTWSATVSQSPKTWPHSCREPALYLWQSKLCRFSQILWCA